MQNNIERYFEFEQKYNLFERKYNGVRFWPLIRCWKIYLEIAGYPSVNRESERNTGDYVKELSLNISRLWDSLGFLMKKRSCDLFVSGNSALRQGLDGKKVHQYFSFLEKQEKYSFIYYNTNVKDDVKEDEKLNQAFVNLSMAFVRILVRLKRKITGYRNCECIEIAEILKKEFDYTIPAAELERMVEESVWQYKLARAYYSFIFKRITCKAIIIEPGYATEHLALTEAAHKRNIPVIELQHGILNSSHPAYNYKDRDKDYVNLPDYICTWGNAWSKMMRMPHNVKVLSCGYPYFDINRNYAKEIKEEENKVVFFTNLYTERLVEIALELEKLDQKKELEIVVKFHPYLQHDWELHRDKFVGSGIRIIHDASVNIYELIASAKHCIGYSSTVLFETLAMDKCTYAVEVDGVISKDLEGIDNIIVPIQDASQLYEHISGNIEKKMNNSDLIMKKRAGENIINEIEKIIG